MNLLQENDGLPSTVGACLASGHCSLGSTKFCLVLLIDSGVFSLRAIGKGCERLDTHIDAHRQSGLGQWRGSVCKSDGGKPPGRTAFDRAGLDGGPGWYRPTQSDLNINISNFGQAELLPIQRETGLLEAMTKESDRDSHRLGALIRLSAEADELHSSAAKENRLDSPEYKKQQKHLYDAALKVVKAAAPRDADDSLS